VPFPSVLGLRFVVCLGCSRRTSAAGAVFLFAGWFRHESTRALPERGGPSGSLFCCVRSWRRLKPCSFFCGLVWHESTRALPGRGGLRVRGSASAVLGLPQRLKPRSLFVGFYGTSKLLPFPSLLVTSFAETRHDHAREGHDFQSCRKRVLRHAALAAEGQVSSLKPG
jgi:hypothetical protein